MTNPRGSRKRSFEFLPLWPRVRHERPRVDVGELRADLTVSLVARTKNACGNIPCREWPWSGRIQPPAESTIRDGVAPLTALFPEARLPRVAELPHSQSATSTRRSVESVVNVRPRLGLSAADLTDTLQFNTV